MSREAAIILLDVSACMQTNNKMGKAIEFVSQYFQKRICSGVADQISIVLFGANDTDNDLAKEKPGYYQSIRVLTPLIEPSIETLKLLKAIRAENGQPDYIEALFVAMDTLVKKIGERQSFEKRIVLVTHCGQYQFKDVDDAEIIISECRKREIKIDIVGIEFDADPSQSQNENKTYNETVLKALANEVKGKCVLVEEALETECEFRVRKPKSISAFRGFLEISPILKIAVWSYLKVVPNNYAAPKKVRKKNGEEVKVQSTFYAKKDGKNFVVEKEDMVKGYKYGKNIISLENFDETMLLYRPPVCLQLIGFTSEDSVPRSHYLLKTEVMLPYRGDNPSAVAMSALVQAMIAERSVAIVRYVKKANSEPQLGVLIPHSTPECDYFYYNKLPFAEDLRQYPMQSLSLNRMRQSHQPSQAQLNAAEALINALDLTSHDAETGETHERFACAATYNPITQYMIQTLQEAVVDPDGAFPPAMNPKIEAMVTPSAEVFYNAEKPISAFAQAFSLYVNPEYAQPPKKRKIQYPDNDAKLASYVTKRAKTSEASDVSAPGLSFKAIVDSRHKQRHDTGKSSNNNHAISNSRNNNNNTLSALNSGRANSPRSSQATPVSSQASSSNNNNSSSFKRTSFGRSRSNSVETMDLRADEEKESESSRVAVESNAMDVETTTATLKTVSNQNNSHSNNSAPKKQQSQFAQTPKVVLEIEEDEIQIRRVDKAEHMVSKYTSIHAEEAPQKVSSASLEVDKFATYSSASTFAHSYNETGSSANQSLPASYSYLEDKNTNADLFKSSRNSGFGSAPTENSSSAAFSTSVTAKLDASPLPTSSNNNGGDGASQSRSLFDFDYDDL